MEDKKKILVVEDDKNIAIVLTYQLKRNGYDVDMAEDGEKGLNMALTGVYDLILLDIMLPKMNGFEVCEKIRMKSQVPIIFVTAREDEQDVILGLETGADDYVTKPYSFPTLLARVRANIKRNPKEVRTEKEESDSVIVIGELTIDPTRYSIKKNDEEIELSRKDYELVLFLAKNLGTAYTRENLLEKIWGYDTYYGDVRNVDVTVSRIRKKIENDPTKPEYIMTKRGVGYYIAEH